ncbi:hypothetical protein CL617_00540 [archaeon]|nr:hypothetical protein [archaeon]|tara:strand:+ start:62 stop:241 length:180 start_codon:yes stop_codon:yes gene_type:complete
MGKRKIKLKKYQVVWKDFGDNTHYTIVRARTAVDAATKVRISKKTHKYNIGVRRIIYIK